MITYSQRHIILNKKYLLQKNVYGKEKEKGKCFFLYWQRILQIWLKKKIELIRISFNDDHVNWSNV